MAEVPHATMSVPREHAIFAGHFPEMPLVPGVMLLEWTLREAARALSVEPRRLRIRESKFFSPLRPDEQAELYFRIEAARHAFRICRGADVLATGILEQT